VSSNKERPSFQRLYQLVVVLAWIVAFWFLLQELGGNPILGKFLRPDYWWLVEMGTAILVFFVMALVYCDPPHGGRRGISLLCQMGIMILPLVYLPTAAVSQLSPDAVKKRSFFLSQTFEQGGKGNFWSKPDSAAGDGADSGRVDEVPENPSFLRLVFKPEPYEGKHVTISGMAYVDDRLPPNSFLCYQLLMFCCAADAKAIGVVVEYDKSDTLKKGEWVKVQGSVGLTSVEGQRLTKITAENVAPTKAPKDPYLFP
jgi:uncharacterized repeat protein (TIGR03943 family)